MGSSKKQTVGYRYSLGMHMVLCHGPVDHLARIDVDAKEAWIGFAKDGTQNINKEELFGGDEREGGVSGPIDIMLGKKTQTPNTYLQARLGAAIPAFRGVFGVVLNQMYLGMNPYLKKWAFRTQRIYATTEGEDTQWYPGTAPIGFTEGNIALYFALDYSGSMSIIEPGNGLSRLQNMKTAVTNALAPLQGIPDNSAIDIKVVGFGTNILSIERFACSGQDITDIIDWIDIRDWPDFVGGETNFAKAYAPIGAFFAATGTKDRISIVITDGEPAASGQTAQEDIDEAAGYLFGVTDIVSYGFNIDLVDTFYTEQLDNTPEDGVPVVSGGSASALTDVLAGILYSQLDMNPTHIIRECLTDAVWGMGYPDVDIDDVSFTAAADTLLNEGMGISLLWDRQIPIEKFVTEIIKHIDAALFVDRQTGKFVLKLIRDDYDVGSLITLDESNIDKITNLNRNSFGELTNSITVTFWDATTEENGSVTVQDTALIQMQNAVINTALQYPGFTNPNLASRVAMRDLKTLSTPLWTCTIYTNQVAKDLNIGDVFKLTWPDYGINEVVMRISGMGFGDGKSNQIQIQATQDQFGVPSVSGVATPDDADGWQPIDTTAQPSPIIMAQEAPYYELTQILTQLDTDTILADNNDVGYVSVAAGRPTGEAHQNAVLTVDSGTGYVESDTLDFSPFAYLTADITKFQTVIPIENGTDLDIVNVGEFAQIDGELVRVDAVSETEVTLGRGILDTIPVKHLAGAAIVFWDPFPSGDEVEYIATETINVKVLPSTLADTWAEASATAYPILMASRAFLPFRPANFRAGGFIDPDPDWEPVYPVLIEWDQRNRLQETGGSFLDWLDGAIAHEATTQYSIQVDAYEEDQLTLIASITTDIETDSDYSLTEAIIGIYDEAPFIKVTITAQRDGYDSYQSPVLFFRSVNLFVFGPPTDYVVYFTMDDADISAPTINDVSGSTNTHNATMVNTPTTGVVGRLGEAVSFLNASSQYATLVDHADLKPADVSISVWIKHGTVSASRWIAGHYTNVTSVIKGHFLYIGSTGLATFGVAKGTGNTISVDFEVARSVDRVDDDEWHHVVGTFDGTTISLYVDGLLIESVTFAEVIVYDASLYRIATRTVEGVIASELDGELDDFKLFTRAISNRETKNTHLVDINEFKDVQDYTARWEMENATTVTKPVDFVAEWVLDTDGSETNAAHPATLVGTPTFAEGFVGNAMVVNGSSQYATIVDHANLKPTNVTVCAWVNTTGINGMVLQNYSRNTNHAGYYLFINGSGGLTFEIGSNTGVVLNVDRATLSSGADDLVNDGNWRHVCGTYDGATLKVYVDGRLAGSIAYAGGLAYDTTTYGRIGIFSAAGAPQFYFNGSIDGAKIFNYAATEGQVKALSRVERDATHRHHHGMVTGSPISSLDTGKIGHAVTLDGTDDFIIIKDHADLKPINASITAWVKSSNALDEDCIFQSYAAATNKSGIRLHLKPTGEVNFTVGKNTGNVLSTDYENAATVETIKDGEWHHIVATFDGTDMKIYLDGLLSVTVAFSGSIGYEATNYVRMGTHNVIGTELWHFNGDLDDTRLYDRALTPLEAYRVYASRIVAPPTNFTAEWTMDDVVGTLLNETNNDHDATLVGTPTFGAGWERDAMTLDGSTQYATIVPDVALRSASITIAAWVKTTNVASSTIFSNFDAVSNIFTGYYFGLSASGRARVYICKGTGAVSGTDFKVVDSTTPVNDGRWHHIAVTFQSTEIKVYVDGTLETTTPWANALVYNGTEEPQIGCREFETSRDSYFDGSVDKLQFFNRAVLESGIEAIAGVIVASP